MQKDFKGELMVTIRCLTYNHEPYISQCLEGFVMQKTNFRFEAIVHDDASTDGTAAIIREYAEKYPDIIKPIFETENQYSKRDGSIRRIMNEHTHGKYVAMCEGDDYWIDPLKLQKQVDFLENNPNYGLCYTKAKQFNQKKQKYMSDISSPYIGINDMIINRNPVTTLTTLFRKKLYDSYIKEINPSEKLWLTGDYPLWIWIGLHSNIHYIDQPTAVYRYLEQSASHAIGDINRQEKFNRSIYDIRKFFLNTYFPNHNYIDIISNDFYRRNFIAGIINDQREYCLINIKNIKKPTLHDKLLHYILRYKFTYKLYRLKNLL